MSDRRERLVAAGSRPAAGALALFAAVFSAAPANADEGETWRALRAGGTVALIRHARAPGTGDPPGFRLGDCATQRNLSEQGRADARRLGERLRAERVAIEAVRSSRWCRALDTASVAFPGIPVTPEPVLDSGFGESGGSAERTRQAAAIVADWAGRGGTLVLVTHQVNITAVTAVYPGEGEVVVVRPGAGGAVEVIGKLLP